MIKTSVEPMVTTVSAAIILETTTITESAKTTVRTMTSTESTKDYDYYYGNNGDNSISFHEKIDNLPYTNKYTLIDIP